jgi:hypothetical protein
MALLAKVELLPCYGYRYLKSAYGDYLMTVDQRSDEANGSYLPVLCLL